MKCYQLQKCKQKFSIAMVQTKVVSYKLCTQKLSQLWRNFAIFSNLLLFQLWKDKRKSINLYAKSDLLTSMDQFQIRFQLSWKTMSQIQSCYWSMPPVLYSIMCQNSHPKMVPLYTQNTLESLVEDPERQIWKIFLLQ